VERLQVVSKIVKCSAEDFYVNVIDDESAASYFKCNQIEGLVSFLNTI
jgi:hypothetical protein